MTANLPVYWWCYCGATGQSDGQLFQWYYQLCVHMV